MVEAAHQALADFVKNKEAAAVLIDSSGDKAFCAGVLSLISNVSKGSDYCKMQTMTCFLWPKLCTRFNHLGMIILQEEIFETSGRLC